MAHSIGITFLIDADLSDEDHARLAFPDRDKDAGIVASGDFRTIYPNSPITGAQFSITPVGVPIPGRPGERMKCGRVAGYYVEVNAPACLNGHNRLLVNGVPHAARAAGRLLKIWLAQNGCTSDALRAIKPANAVIDYVTLIFLFNMFTEEKAREALQWFRDHSEAVMNSKDPDAKPRAFSIPPKPKSPDEKYTYTSYVRMREFLISAYVKERDQPGAFLMPIADEFIEEGVQAQSEGTLRVKIKVHGKWLKENGLNSIAAWQGNDDAYRLVFALIRSTLRLDEKLRTKSLKRTSVDGLHLSARAKGYLLKHLNGMNVRNDHPDVALLGKRWAKTYSAARWSIMQETGGIDLNIPYKRQLAHYSAALAELLTFRTYRPPNDWARHVFSSESARLVNLMLDVYLEEVLKGIAWPLPLRDDWWSWAEATLAQSARRTA